MSRARRQAPATTDLRRPCSHTPPRCAGAFFMAPIKDRPPGKRRKRYLRTLALVFGRRPDQGRSDPEHQGGRCARVRTDRTSLENNTPRLGRTRWNARLRGVRRQGGTPEDRKLPHFCGPGKRQSLGPAQGVPPDVALERRHAAGQNLLTSGDRMFERRRAQGANGPCASQPSASSSSRSCST